MKRKLTLFFGVIIALTAVVTALTVWPNSVLDSNSVLNPSDVLSSDYNYSTLQYATNITCPLGNFNRSSNLCQHSLSGTQISGWEVVSFNSTINNVTKITSIASDLNLGCTNCSTNSTGYYIFYTGGGYGNSTNWTYAGFCGLTDNVNGQKCFFFPTNQTSIKNILIGRNNIGDTLPDPAVHSISVAY